MRHKLQIQLDLSLQQLIDRTGDGMIKVITGLSRSGKPFILSTLINNFAGNSTETRKNGKA